MFRSLSSTSFCLIFLTTSTSCESATYRLFVGDTVCSAETGAAEGVDAGGFCSGEPGGVVESTVNELICRNSFKAMSTCTYRPEMLFDHE